ncbi:MAG: hypothetical protein ACLVEX_07620 [Ruthenibacterium lactatiformans]
MLQLLLKQTDEHHYATGADILRFWETHGIQTTRKNVYSDIQLLMDFGLDVICIKSTQNRYFVGSRLLELPELKLLVDAVESSHLITEKKSTALIEKLGHLTSRHNAALLNRPVYMDGTAKPDNEAVYYAIDAIQTAIHKQRAISFQYFEYTPKKEKVLKHKGLPLWISALHSGVCPRRDCAGGHPQGDGDGAGAYAGVRRLYL